MKILRPSWISHFIGNPIFWGSMWIQDRLQFTVLRFFYLANKKLSIEKNNTQSLVSIAKLTFCSLLASLLFTYLLVVVVDPVFIYIFKPKFKFITGNILPFLSTTASIGGVFIGLYYAATTTVGSGFYAKVPSNVRDLLASDRVSYIYIRYLTFVTCVALWLTVFFGTNLPKPYIAGPIMILLAGIGIVAFMKLGQRAFYLFDPTNLSMSVFEGLYNCVVDASARSGYWSNPSFQAHSKKVARSYVEALLSLSEIAQQEEHLSGRSYSDLTKKIVHFLVFYESKKKLIPTKSLWFQQKHTHRQWYRTDWSAVSIAERTGTALASATTSDFYWIEDLLLRIVSDFVRTSRERDNIRPLLEVLQSFQIYLHALCVNGEISQVLTNINALIPLLRLDKTNVSEFIADTAALVEWSAMLPIELFLRLLEGTKASSKSNLTQMIQSIDWSRPESKYKETNRFYLLSRLESLQEGLDIEIAVHGWIISPNWWLVESLSQVSIEKLIENIETVLAFERQFYPALTLRVHNASPWLQALVISRNWEFVHKVLARESEILASQRDYNSARFNEKLPWKEADLTVVFAEFQAALQGVVRQMAKCLPDLLTSEQPAGFPDIRGQFSHTLIEALLDAAIEHKPEFFAELFPVALEASIRMHALLAPEVPESDWRYRYQEMTSLGPLLDICNLLGFTKILAEYHQDQAMFTNARDLFIVTIRNDQNVFRIFLTAVVKKRDLFLGSPRDILHTSWQQRIERLLRSMPVHMRSARREERHIYHPSLLVRVLARQAIRMSIFHSGMEFFKEYVLKEVLDPKFHEVIMGRDNLSDTLNREHDRILQARLSRRARRTSRGNPRR